MMSNDRVREIAAAIAGYHAQQASEKRIEEMTKATVMQGIICPLRRFWRLFWGLAFASSRPFDGNPMIVA